MPKLARIEDVIQIVGMKNYIDAIDLDIDCLSYLGSKILKNKTVEFLFEYQNKKQKHVIKLVVDSSSNVQEVKCDCKKFEPVDYCPHVGLVIMHILTHDEIIKEGLDELNNQHDEEFNRYLFSTLSKIQNKKQMKLEIKLIPDYYGNHFQYELNIKIGDNKLYVLKKHLQRFLENYPEGEEEITFGKDFVYHSSRYYFSKEDEKIIDFLKFYVDSQVERKTYYNYYIENNIQTIKLSGNTLLEFLKLIENRSFKIERGYREQKFSKIEKDLPFEIQMEEIQKQLRLRLQYDDIMPLTEDYRYFMDDKKCYQVEESVGQFLKVMVMNHRKQLWFTEEEFKQFSTTILPSVYQLDPQVKMPEELKTKFILEKPKVKFYFESKKNMIQAQIKLSASNKEWNLFEEADIYVLRNLEQEQLYQDELIKYQFEKNEKKPIFELKKEDDIVDFLENGLKKLTDQYEVYVSKELKNMKVLKNTSVKSEFGIGSDQILSYQFNIEGIDKKEMKDLLDAVKWKKKYYRLKNGDYVHIEDNEKLHKVNELIEELELTNKDLMLDSIPISKYKSMQVKRIVEEENMDFVKLDQSFEDLIQNFNQYKKSKIKLSKGDLDILRDYQELGVKWLMTISNCGFGGVLADEMGLGKSIQTIKYIKLKLQQNEKAKFLIVVPTSLIYNWENEFKKFEKNISVLLMSGNREKRHQLFEKMDSYQVIITSYGLLRQDLEYYQRYHFDTCVIDEAQNIKNLNAESTKACKSIQAGVKFALTGTPIENSILELWSIFDFIMPGYLKSVSRFKQTYSPKKTSEDPELLKQLNRQISPFVLRRKKKDVLKDLPSKLENQVLVELDDYEKQLYVGQLKITKEKIEETLQAEGFMKSQILILSLLTKLRQICIDSRLLVEKENHVSSKIKTLLDIVKGSITNGHKILVFSQFPSALSLVRQEFDQEQISYYYLDGSTPSKRRMEMAESFNKDDTNVFLISLKAGGTGLNLTSADIVIHLDPWWNPQVENQATDRSHRIGQKNVVEVIKLVAKGTIEEKIIELQNKKKNLSDQVIEGEDRDQIILSKLTEKELRNLLES